jgi:hypothetical protein
MAGFQTRIVAQISLQNINNQGNPIGQVLTLGGPGNPATMFAPCIGAAGGEAAAITASLAVLSTAITATCATPFLTELIAQETGGG